MAMTSLVCVGVHLLVLDEILDAYEAEEHDALAQELASIENR
jgi:hypothetical protein